MKKFWKEFFLRGLIVSSGGPVVLAIIYGILGAAGEVSQLTPSEVCLGIITITLLAFLAAGMTAVYKMEQLPLAYYEAPVTLCIIILDIRSYML